MTVLIHAFPDEADAARRLAGVLNSPLAFVETHTFPDGEVLPRVAPATPTTILYRSLNRPNAKLVELLLTADGLRRAGAQRLILVAPYLPYMRQDTQFHPGEPVSQHVVARMLDGTFDLIVTVDPHLHRTASLAEVIRKTPICVVHGMDALAMYLRRHRVDPGIIVVGPDQESTAWVERLSSRLGLEAAVLGKQRHGDRNVEISLPAGFDPDGRTVLLVDDICSSGSTLRAVAGKLRSAGARSVTVFVTHALCDDNVLKELHGAGVERLISSDSCIHRTNAVELADIIGATLRAYVEESAAGSSR
jgi:ribose-phosphate pyrophosphokinase